MSRFHCIPQPCESGSIEFPINWILCTGHNWVLYLPSLLTYHQSPKKQVALLSPFYLWGNRDLERLNDFPKVTRLESGRARIWTRVDWLQRQPQIPTFTSQKWGEGNFLLLRVLIIDNVEAEITARQIPVCWHLSGCRWRTPVAGGAAGVGAHLADKGKAFIAATTPHSPSSLCHLSFCWEDGHTASATGRTTPVCPQKLVPPVQEVNSLGIGPLTVILTPRIWRHWMGSVNTQVMSRITSANTRAATSPSSCRSLMIWKRVKVIIFLSSPATQGLECPTCSEL